MGRGMRNKYVFAAALLLTVFLGGAGITWLSVDREAKSNEENSFTVITSFYPMYIAAKNIIGDAQVELMNLSEPKTGCMHDYQLTTEDMKKLSAADVFIVNGGGIENFLADVAKQLPKLKIIYACENIELLDENAHVWMSVSDYGKQVREITAGLVKADRKHAREYKKNGDRYLGALEELNRRKDKVAALAKGKKPVLFHEAFAYLARDLKMEVCASMDLDEERQVSAGEVKNIVQKVRDKQASMILAEKLYGQEMSEAVQRETGVDVLYLDTCVRGDYDADSYLDAMSDNLKKIESLCK